MADYTPGPWTANLEGARGNQAGGFSVEKDGIIICGRAGWPDRAEESHANARLIAAAPDLLAAAKDAYVALPRSKHNEPINAALVAAIAKAEGR